MDNQDIVREFQQVNAEISALGERLGELAKSNAVMAAQMKEMVEQRRELRSDLAPVVDWVKAQMTGGLTQRMDTLERDMSGVKDGLDELRTMAQRVIGGAAVLMFLWGIFGDVIKARILGR